MPVIQNIVKELQDFDWTDLQDMDTIGVWPTVVKLLITTMILAACLAAGYFLHIQNLQLQLQQVIDEEATLRVEFEQKAFLAANLEEYRAQTVEMEESFNQLLQQLPSVTEVPGLVDDITETGTGSGLEFVTIAPVQEIAQEFYIELPINIEVVGDYHDFGMFVSGVASLDRIVTLHDFSIDVQSENILAMSIQARTYRYKELDGAVE